MRFRLRDRVSALHERLDQTIEAKCFAAGVRLDRLLMIHHQALTAIVPALERAQARRALPGWDGPSRLSAIEADLKMLGITPAAQDMVDLVLAADEEIWGFLYVLEGSSLGGRILLRRVEHDGSPAQLRALRYLRGSGVGGCWSSLISRLDALDYHGDPFEIAVAGARKAFDVYLAAATRL
jgi:heme oxygenase